MVSYVDRWLPSTPLSEIKQEIKTPSTPLISKQATIEKTKIPRNFFNKHKKKLHKKSQIKQKPIKLEPKKNGSIPLELKKAFGVVDSKMLIPKRNSSRRIDKRKAAKKISSN